MRQHEAWVNLALGAAALIYSMLPPDRVRGYKPGVALAMRYLGLFLLLLALASLWVTKDANHN